MTKYSIDQFSQITGITKFVLRTWENRYGFLKAQRTDTKIRFYTDELLVRALNSNYLLENGYKISVISKLSHDEISSKVDEIKNGAEDNSIESYYIVKLIESALDFDSNLFNSTYDKGVQELGILEFYKSVLLVTFSKIGIFWLTNRIAPSQEHFLSELVKQKIGAAADSVSYDDTKKDTWLLFLPENEFHEIGLLFAKFLLIKNGFEVVYLGSNVPYGSLLELAEKKHIDNVLFFSVSNTSKSNLDFTINYLNKSFPKSNHFLVANSLDINFLTKDHNITILDNLDDFVKIIS
ncbi:MAG: MerR family transcriptional regulator [Bacteroidota bacterium]|nr:MerR family transcriptional regulator [Bacteroidota bacterium]